MKPEKQQEQLVCEQPTNETACQLATGDQPQTECATDTTDAFEAILEAYARDPERWDGLE
jgi:hypothetical protein